MNNSNSLTLSGSPLGAGWGFLYGYGEVPALSYLPELRQIGGGLTKVYLFWNQIEPQKEVYDWEAVDAFVDQLAAPEEGLISLFSSSLWGAQRPAALLPASPARDLADYYRFVQILVKHCMGRVRYWQNDAEPNSSTFWSGSKEEYAAQLNVFYRAVKDADPFAVVIVGGYEGLFNPPGMQPFPNQQEGLDFFDFVLRAGKFDLFDMHLYNDPYTIPACVDFIRQRMAAIGVPHPMVCTEYGGPGFFAFDENRQYLSLIASWAKSGRQTDDQGFPGEDTIGKNRIEDLYRKMFSLAPQTQMFMQGCSPELQAKFERIQACDLVTRTVLGLSAGMQKMIYWQVLAGGGPREDLMDLMYGKIGMLEFTNGKAARRRPVAGIYERMANFLFGVSRVTRIDCPEQPSIYLFQVERRDRQPGFIVWERRDPFYGEESPATPAHFVWGRYVAKAVDALGQPVPVQIREGAVHLAVSDTPVYIDEDELNSI